VGEFGVGKQSIVEGLAQRIAREEVAEPLAGKHLVAIDRGQLVGGATWTGDVGSASPPW